MGWFGPVGVTLGSRNIAHIHSACYAIGCFTVLQAGTQGSSAYTCLFRQFACLGPHMIRGPAVAAGCPLA